MHSSYHFSSTSFFYQNDRTTPPHPPTPIPIHSPTSTPTPIPIPIHHPTSTLNAAATKIQSRYRAHLIQIQTRKILAVRSETDRIQRWIQRQETVDAVRTNEKERLRINEELMRLILRLDSVPGWVDGNVREVRRALSRRIVGLQETLDGIVGEEVDGSWGEFLEKIWIGEGEIEDTWDARAVCDDTKVLWW